jgi:hypothetical protein
MVFLGYYHCPLLYYIEGIRIIALIEDYLSFFIGLGMAGGSKSVFLLLSELTKERENL